jgi:hypothetical protein
MHTSRRAPARIALVILGGIVAVLGLAQLLLPVLAAQRVRSQLGRYGTVRSASVSAFPAIELLWGSAQSATVSAGSLSMEPAQVGALLWQGRGVQRIEMRAESIRVGPLRMLHVSSHKRGEELYTQGSVTEADLRAALPGSTAVQPLGRTPAGVEVRVSGSLFGVGASVEVLLSALEGKLVAQPQGIPLAGLVKLVLFSNPHLYVQDFDLASPPSAGGASGGSAGEAGGEGGDPSYLLRLWAKLR